MNYETSVRKFLFCIDNIAVIDNVAVHEYLVMALWVVLHEIVSLDLFVKILLKKQMSKAKVQVQVHIHCTSPAKNNFI